MNRLILRPVFGSGCASVDRGPGRPGQSLPSVASGPATLAKQKAFLSSNNQAKNEKAKSRNYAGLFDIAQTLAESKGNNRKTCAQTHTCSEWPLRIAKWNASYVQKQLSHLFFGRKSQTCSD